jgi:hypothetical protein
MVLKTLCLLPHDWTFSFRADVTQKKITDVTQKNLRNICEN